MTPEEVDAFVKNGQSQMTMFAQAQAAMERWAESFEVRGGTPVYGDDALRIVTLSNDLVVWLTPERKAIIADLRLDV